MVDPHALTDKLLEVLPAWPEELKGDAIAFLPEVAAEEDHEAVGRGVLVEGAGRGAGLRLWCAGHGRALLAPSASTKLDHPLWRTIPAGQVLEALGELVADQGGAALVPQAIEALGNLGLAPELAERAVALVLDRLQGAAPADLPGLVRFLLQHAAGEQLRGVVRELRASLHFVDPSDPRLAAPDQKGKARAAEGGRESLEARLLEGVRQALQLSPAAADAVARQLRELESPSEHRTFDCWLLLTLLSLGPERRRAAEAVLRRKLAGGQANGAWLARSVGGPHACVLADRFPALLALAQQLLRAPAPAVAAGGEALYVALFASFADAYSQQEVGGRTPAASAACIHAAHHERSLDALWCSVFREVMQGHRA